jgi:hypothetical protein
MNRDLKIVLKEWDQWSLTADKSEDGWQAIFPDWQALVSAAKELMEQANLSEEEFQMLETSWKLSEEDENLADFAKVNLESCWTNIVKLTTSRHAEVRWQVYEVLGFAASKGEDVLQSAVNDTDAYCRRRAILSLVKLRPSNAIEVGKRYINDPDPYVRRVAIALTNTRGTN